MITQVTTALAIAATLSLPPAPASTFQPTEPPAHSFDVRSAIRSEVRLAIQQAAPTPPPEAKPAQSRRKRHPAVGILATVLGGGVGLVVGGAIGGSRAKPCNCDDPGLAEMVQGALIGGVIGSILGGIFLFR